MSKANRVSISELEKLYSRCNNKNVLHLFVGEGENRFEFEVRHRLSASDAANIVATVCDGVVDSATGSYRPELKDYFLRVAVLKTYTNITLPEDDRRWDLVYGTPVFAMVAGHDKRPVTFNGWEYDDNEVIDVEQYEQIVAAIDKKVAYSIRKSEQGGESRVLHQT